MGKKKKKLCHSLLVFVCTPQVADIKWRIDQFLFFIFFIFIFLGGRPQMPDRPIRCQNLGSGVNKK